jgi:hypothetical protein
MRAEFILLAAAALAPLAASHALEAVAQQPYMGGSGNAGASLATDAKVQGIDARVDGVNQRMESVDDRLKHFEECAAMNPPQVWNGTSCVAVGGGSVSTTVSLQRTELSRHFAPGQQVKTTCPSGYTAVACHLGCDGFPNWWDGDGDDYDVGVYDNGCEGDDLQNTCDSTIGLWVQTVCLKVVQ